MGCKIEPVEKIAAYIVRQYKMKFQKDIDQMKLHKLLYFAQRESYILYDKPLFNGVFHAGKYGPIVIKIRDLFNQNNLKEFISDDYVRMYQGVFDRIWNYYAPKDSWSLSLLSHGEISWKNAMDKRENDHSPYVCILEDDIKKDAEKIKFRRQVIASQNNIS